MKIMLLKLFALIFYLLLLFISGDSSAADSRPEPAQPHLQQGLLLKLSSPPREAPINASNEGTVVATSALPVLHADIQSLSQQETKASAATFSSPPSKLSLHFLTDDIKLLIASFLTPKDRIEIFVTISRSIPNIKEKIIKNIMSGQPLKVRYAEEKGKLIFKPQIPQDVAKFVTNLIVDARETWKFSSKISQVDSPFQIFTHLQKLHIIPTDSDLCGISPAIENAAVIFTDLKNASLILTETLTDLDISDVPLPHNEEIAACALQQFEHLQKLCMRYSCRVKSPNKLATVLRGVSPTLTDLDIVGRSINPENVGNLAQSLQRLELLQTLTICYNPIGAGINTLLNSVSPTLTVNY